MDRSLYHPDWVDIIRPSILKRDNYSCRVCGVRHKSTVYKLSRGGYFTCDQFAAEWAKANGKHVFTLFLVVAHLDQDKTNNDPSNLMTLCPIHHASYDAKHRTLKRKMKFAQVQEIKHLPLPENLQLMSDHLGDLSKLVKELTAVQISKSEAESLFQLTLKFLQNEQNK